MRHLLSEILIEFHQIAWQRVATTILTEPMTPIWLFTVDVVFKTKCGSTARDSQIQTTDEWMEFHCNCHHGWPLFCVTPINYNSPSLVSHAIKKDLFHFPLTQGLPTSDYTESMIWPNMTIVNTLAIFCIVITY